MNSKPPQKLQAHNYMLCVIVEFGHRRIFSPDFDIHFTVPTSADPHKWTAITLAQVEHEIQSRLKTIEAQGEEPPTPKKWRDVVNPVPKDLIGIDEAAALLNVSASTLRRNKEIPCHETPGGHRRYSIKELKTYLKTET